MSTHDSGPELRGRRILITGAAGVLGRATALAAASAGAELILLARRKAQLEALDDAIAAAGGPSPLLVEFDFLRREEAHYAELAAALATDGLDDLILAAGLNTGLHPLEHLSDRDWQRIMTVNLHAPFRLTKHLLELLKSRRGRLIGVSDRPGRAPGAYWGAYAASKAGLDALLALCAQESEGRVAVHRFEPEPMASKLRGIVYPGETPQQLPELAPQVRRLLQLPGPEPRTA